MKKIILSAGVIILFSLYSFYVHQTPPSSSSIATEPTFDMSSLPNNRYKDGEYTGTVADAFYGDVEVKTTIENGQMVDLAFLQYPNERQNSIQVNTMAMPVLETEAIQAQSSAVDTVTGATYTSKAFIESLQSALDQAK